MKLTKPVIIISIVVILLLAGLMWFFYRRGKKQVTLQNLPGELPGNPGSGNVTGASNDEIKSIASDLYRDMDGINVLGHKTETYLRAVMLGDTDLIKLYNTFNSLYQKQSGETLTQWLGSEKFSSVFTYVNPLSFVSALSGFDTSQHPGIILMDRLKKLNAL